MSRSVAPRFQENAKEMNESNFEYPFSCFKDEYIHESDPMPGEPVYPVENFPNNIKEWIWASPGSNDEYPWYLLGRLDNGKYFFYHAWCDYQGGMKLSISEKLDVLIMKAMTDDAYKLYIENTN